PAPTAMSIGCADRGLYVGGPNAALYRSPDGGQTWTALQGLVQLCASSGRDRLRGAFVWMIAASPVDANLLLGTLMDRHDDAIASSTDRGLTWKLWNEQPKDPRGSPFLDVVWHPRTHGCGYAVGGSGVARTRDAGTSWQLAVVC